MSVAQQSLNSFVWPLVLVLVSVLLAHPSDADPVEIVLETDLVFGSESLLNIEIGGTSIGPPPEYDRLIVDGSVALDGTLALNFINNIRQVISSEDNFVVINTANGISGAWANVANGERLGLTNGTGTFLVSYGAGSLFDPTQLVLSGFQLPSVLATWNGGMGNWSSANWTFLPSDLGDPDFPNNTDSHVYDAVVTDTDQVTVDQDIDINVLSLYRNAFVHVDNNLTTARLNLFAESRVDGSATIITGGGQIDVSCPTCTILLDAALQNTGTLSWLDGHVAGTGGALTNVGGATFDIMVTEREFFFPSITNQPGATIRRDGPNIAELRDQLDNAGLVQVDRGTLEVDRGTSTGTFSVNNDGILRFDVDGDTATHTISGAVMTTFDAGSPDPAPIVHFADGTTIVTGQFHVGDAGTPGTTIITVSDNATRLDYDNPNELGMTNVLDLSRGVLGGTGDFEVGTLNWHAGRFERSGQTTIGGGEIFDAPNTHLERKLLGTLHNNGFLIWSGDNVGHISDAAGTFVNNRRATLNITLDSNATFSRAISIANEPGATIRRDGSATAFIEGPLDNAGLVEVDGGTLEIDRGTSSGTFVVNNGGILRFDIDDNAETHTISGAVMTTFDAGSPDPPPIVTFGDGTTIVTGQFHVGDAGTPGTTIITVGGNATRLDYDNTNEPATMHHLEMMRGTLGGTGDVDVGTLAWQGGRFDGSAVVTVGGGDIQGGPNANERRLNAALRNNGLLTWSGGGVRSDGGSLVNAAGAEFTITTPNDESSTFSANITLTNPPGATIRRRGIRTGVGTATLAGPVDTTGSIIVENGRLRLDNLLQLNVDTLSAGTYEIHDSGVLDTPGSDITNNDAVVVLRGSNSSFASINALVDNAGRFEIHEGRDFNTTGDLMNSGALVVGNTSTFTVHGMYTQTGVRSQLDVQAGGLFQVTQGRVQIRNGAALTGNGTIEAAGEIVIDQGGVLAPGASPGTITTSDLTFGDGAIYRWDLDADRGDSVVVDGTLTFGATATLELIDLGGTPDPLTEFVLFSYTPTVSDPVDPVWMIDNTAAPAWDISAANIVVDAARDRVLLRSITIAADFDKDGDVDIDDIDSLVMEIAAMTNTASFDLTDDGLVNGADLTRWLSDAAGYNGFGEAFLPGDSNLDGSVGAVDLNNLALSWRQGVALWSAGDFTADGTVGAADLNALALNWRKSIATASVTSAPVPEPSALVLALSIAGLALFRLGRRLHRSGC